MDDEEVEEVEEDDEEESNEGILSFNAKALPSLFPIVNGVLLVFSS